MPAMVGPVMMGASFDAFHSSTPAIMAFAAMAVFSDHMFAVFQVQQGPQLGIAPQDNMASASAIAAVRPALGFEFFPVKVQTARAAVTGAGVKFNIVYKVIAHGQGLELTTLCR